MSEWEGVGGLGNGAAMNPRLLGPRARRKNESSYIGFMTLKSTSSIPRLELYIRCYRPHSTDEETEAQRQEATCPRPHGIRTLDVPPPDPGGGMESWFFFCDPNSVTRSTRDVCLHLNSDDVVIVSQKWLPESLHAWRLCPVLTRKQSQFTLSCSLSSCSVEGRLAAQPLPSPWNPGISPNCTSD